MVTGLSIVNLVSGGNLIAQARVDLPSCSGGLFRPSRLRSQAPRRTFHRPGSRRRLFPAEVAGPSPTIPSKL